MTMKRIIQLLDRARIASYTRRCTPWCSDSSVHTGHLTPMGRYHYTHA